MIYLIGDTHFGHDNIIKYENRPFQDSYEMDKLIVKNWNKVVSNEDIVYHFGDFALCATDRYMDIFKRLNGEIHLIKGNHDQQSHTKLIERMGFKSEQERLFLNGFLCTHRPVENSLYFNIHGHTHSQRIDDSKHFCVSVEKISYTPISLKRAKRKINSLTNKT